MFGPQAAEPKPKPTTTKKAAKKPKPEPTATANEAEKKEEPEAYFEKECFMKHPLSKFFVADAGRVCSICERKFPKGVIMFSCDLCNYDECEECSKLPRNDPLKEQRWKCSEPPA